MRGYRILVVGDSPSWQEALVAAFGDHDGFQVIGAYAPPEKWCEEVGRCHPDVVLAKVPDEHLPNVTQAVTDLHSHHPFTTIMLLVDDPRRLDLEELVHAGVRACLPLRLLPRQIVQAVELVLEAGIMCLPRPAGETLKDAGTGRSATRVKGLSLREQKILQLLGQNLSNKEIASALHISESTVKSHLENIYRKLGARNRTEAAVLAAQAQLTPPAKP